MSDEFDPQEEAEQIRPEDVTPERIAVYGTRCTILRGPFAGQFGIHTGTVTTPFGPMEVVWVDNIGEMQFKNEDIGFEVKS